jgi:preprotein translocase subunit SecE
MKRLIQYLKDSRQELRHVTWPTREQALKLSAFVIVFSLIMAAYLGALDLGLSDALKKLVVPH